MNGLTESLTRRRALVPLCLSALFGFGWYLAHGGLGTLDPRQDGWLQSEDLSQHYLGWLHFRRAGWAWPLGHLPNLAYPVGTTVGFMDANPWLSLLLRPFSRWLPLRFQFQGLWLASCYTLLGAFSWRTARCLTRDGASGWLLAALVTTAPSALLRVCHENLAAQWFIVSGIWLCLREPERGPLADGAAAAAAARREARGCVAWSLALFGWSIGAHAYLTAMSAPLWALAIARRVACDRSLSPAGGALALGSMGALGACLLWAFGFVGTGIAQTEPGFGEQVADLTALFNPVDWSRWLPSLPKTPDQFEGFCYLGLGAMALVGAAGCLRLGRGRPAGAPPSAADAMWRPLALVAMACACFALSDQIWFQGRMVVCLRGWTRPLLGVLGIFRASGRFLWVTQYVLLFASAHVIVRRLPAARARAVLAACLALQLGDLTPVDVREKLVRRQPTPLKSPVWREMGREFRHLALVPAFFPSNKEACGWHYRWGYHVPFSFAAYDADMTFNSNYAGRADAVRIGEACLRLRGDLAAGRFDANTVYVVAEEALPLFADGDRLACEPVDGFTVCAMRSPAAERLFRHLL